MPFKAISIFLQIAQKLPDIFVYSADRRTDVRRDIMIM